MLDILRRIVQEVSSATDLSDALKVVVARIREAMHTEVCSVYLYDPESKRYVLMATEGLNQDAVGKVSLMSSQGLVGLVGTREEPLNIDNAPAHPRFQFLPETGEDPFLSFLGVPIIHHKRLMGVMVVQQRDSRQFDESEEAFLVTMSAQLAGVIAHAEATGNILHLPTEANEKKKSAKFGGAPGAPGVGLGEAVVITPAADLVVLSIVSLILLLRKSNASISPWMLLEMKFVSSAGNCVVNYALKKWPCSMFISTCLMTMPWVPKSKLPFIKATGRKALCAVW